MNDKNFEKKIIQWDVANWSQALHYWETQLGKMPAPLKCLELGSRQGGLSLWLASKGHEVICSDLISTKLNAFPSHQKHNVNGKISYEDIDATDIPYQNYFDVIVFKSILGGIGRNNNIDLQKAVIKQIHKALKPGGMLFFAENAPSTLLHREFRKHFTAWGNSWRYVSAKEMKIFLADFSTVEIKSCGFLGTFGVNEKQKQFLGNIDKFISPVIPSSFNYIIYGSAKK